MGTDVEEGQPSRRSAIHLAVSDACNNSCVFCLNSRVDGRIGDQPIQHPKLEDVRHDLDEGRKQGLEEVWFTIAEPTISRNLVAAVRHAHETGYRRIGMNTNGRRLGKGNLLERLLEAGMDTIMLSVHGPDAAIHDRLVGRDGAYDEVVSGLEAARSFRERYSFRLNFYTVLNRANLPRLEEMVRFFRSYAVDGQGDTICFAAMKRVGLAIDVWDELGLRYAELTDTWLSVWRAAGCPGDMMLSEVPGCVILQRGRDGLPIPPLDVPEVRQVPQLERDPAGPESRDPESEGAVSDPGYLKRPECSDCRLDPVCPGVIEAYAAHFGFDEFPPFQGDKRGMKEMPGRANGDEGQTPSNRLLARLLGKSLQSLSTSGIEVTAIQWNGDSLELSLRGPDRILFHIGIGTREDSQAAYRRTDRLNFWYRASVEHPLIPLLVERMADRLASVSFQDIGRAWEQIVTTEWEQPDSDDRTPLGRPRLPRKMQARLEEDFFGDTVCGMMATLEVFRQMESKFTVIVHGERGCLQTLDMKAIESYREGRTLVHTSDMAELEVLDGGESRLAETIDEVIGADSDKTTPVIVISTCLSEVIGDDLEEVTRDAEERHSVPVIPIRANGLKSVGMVEIARRVQGALANRFVRPGNGPLSGLSFIGYPDQSRVFGEELTGVLSEAGIPLLGSWPSGGLPVLKNLGSARSVFIPERVVYSSLLDCLEERSRTDVVEHWSPFGIRASQSFYEAVGSVADKVSQVLEAIESRKRQAEVLLERFRSRHSGKRVAVSFGNNQKGSGVAAATHFRIGYVPMLEELGLVPVLVALTEESPERVHLIRDVARRLNADPEVFVHRRPEGLVPILEETAVDFAVNEECQKHYIDEVGIPYVNFRRFEIGFAGLERTLGHLEEALA